LLHIILNKQHLFVIIVQVNLIKDDGQVIHFNNPKVQASLTANTFAITGHAETKSMQTISLALSLALCINSN